MNVTAITPQYIGTLLTGFVEDVQERLAKLEQANTALHQENEQLKATQTFTQVKLTQQSVAFTALELKHAILTEDIEFIRTVQQNAQSTVQPGRDTVDGKVMRARAEALKASSAAKSILNDVHSKDQSLRNVLENYSAKYDLLAERIQACEQTVANSTPIITSTATGDRVILTLPRRVSTSPQDSIGTSSNVQDSVEQPTSSAFKLSQEVALATQASAKAQCTPITVYPNTASISAGMLSMRTARDSSVVSSVTFLGDSSPQKNHLAPAAAIRPAVPTFDTPDKENVPSEQHTEEAVLPSIEPMDGIIEQFESNRPAKRQRSDSQNSSAVDDTICLDDGDSDSSGIIVATRPQKKSIRSSEPPEIRAVRPTAVNGTSGSRPTKAQAAEAAHTAFAAQVASSGCRRGPGSFISPESTEYANLKEAFQFRSGHEETHPPQHRKASDRLSQDGEDSQLIAEGVQAAFPMPTIRRSARVPKPNQYNSTATVEDAAASGE
ncbi:hypothetical protein LTR62_006918 [Meristemomyces frigidus]|uniref:Uncharacterized protein n=1 Tax=Meristemomyces frigidus TaxID=1508187 RepID=A0AAN7TMZ0_9PEZI|nr:hypothetical protein LTR62_006918 [Meristemomyces frigidus]